MCTDYIVKTGRTYRIITDHLGSVRLVVDAETGGIAQRLDYDEFGRVLQDTSPGFQPFGFAGGLYDPDTELVRFGFRDYEAGIGRWISKDPVLFKGGQVNLYLYCRGYPVNLVDSFGLSERCEAIEAFGYAGFLTALGVAAIIADPSVAVILGASYFFGVPAGGLVYAGAKLWNDDNSDGDEDVSLPPYIHLEIPPYSDPFPSIPGLELLYP